MRELHGALRLRGAAADATLQHPLRALAISVRGVKTEGPMAPEISLANQRPAQYVFDGQMQLKLFGNPRQRSAREGRERSSQEGSLKRPVQAN